MKAKKESMNYVVAQQEWFWMVIKLAPFRRTPGVYIDIVPMDFLQCVDDIER